MKSDKLRAKDHSEEMAKKMRLATTLTGVFDKATLLILGFADVATPQGTKEARMRALIIRAKNRGCKKYIIAREYAETGALAAFYIYTDIDTETGEDVCKRWDLGPHIVRSIDTNDGATYNTGVFMASNRIPKRRCLYTPCEGIWDERKALPAQ